MNTQDNGRGNASGKKETVSAESLIEKLKVHLADKNIPEDVSGSENGRIAVRFFKNGEEDETAPQEENPESEQKLEGLIEQIFEGDVAEVEADIEEESKRKALFEEREAEKRRDFDDADYDLMSIFGYLPGEAEEDASAAGKRRDRKKRIAEVDLSDPQAVAAKRRAYKKRFVLALLAVAGAAILLLLALAADIAPIAGAALPSFLNLVGYPTVALLLYIQVVIVSVAMQYRSFFSGIGSLFRGRFAPSQIYILISLAFIAYYAVLMIIGCDENTLTFIPAYTFTALISAIHTFTELTCEIYSFNVAVSNKEKYVFVKPSEETVREERRMLGGLVDENRNFFVLTKTRLISGFNGRSFATSGKRQSIAYIGTYIIAFTVIFTITAIFRNGLRSALSYGMCALIFTAPAALFFVFGHARLVQSRKLASKGSAIIGEGSFDEFGKPSSIIMTDREIFSEGGKIQLLDIHGYGDVSIDSALGYAAAVFTKLNCCLAGIFTNIATDYEVSEDVEIAAVSDDGIEASVDGIGVMIGKFAYMRKLGMAPKNESAPYETDEFYLYIAVDGKCALRVCLKYSPSAAFIDTVGKLLRKDSNVIIRTCDPNVNMKMLEDLMNIGALSPVRIIKSETDVTAEVDKSDAGIMNPDGIYALSKTLARSVKVRHAMNAGIVLSVISMIFGSAIIVALFAINESGAMIPFYAIAYQMIWMIAVLLVDRLTI